MPFTFPSNPSDGDTHVYASNTYVYNGVSRTWAIQIADDSVVITSANSSASYDDGTLWFNTDNVTLNVRYEGTWVSISGPKGDRGTKGETGDKGLTGNTGPQGLTGNTGPQGIQGPTGNTGPQGLTGNTGPQGIPGTAGGTASRSAAMAIIFSSF